MPTWEAKFSQKSLQKLDIPNQFQKLFKPALWYCFNIKLLKFFFTIFFFLHLFLFTWNISLCLVFRPSHIWLDIHSRDVYDTQRAFGDLRHLNSTRALGHSKGTHALEGHWSIRTLGYLGQWGNRALRHSGNWALGALKDLGNRALGYLRHSSFLALGHLSLVFIWNSALRERGDSIITLRPGG